MKTTTPGANLLAALLALLLSGCVTPRDPCAVQPEKKAWADRTESHDWSTTKNDRSSSRTRAHYRKQEVVPAESEALSGSDIVIDLILQIFFDEASYVSHDGCS
jgi:hypothetical protein